MRYSIDVFSQYPVYRYAKRPNELNEYLYTIDKPFILVKENGKWKVDEYTSIFEFDDSEINILRKEDSDE